MADLERIEREDESLTKLLSGRRGRQARIPMFAFLIAGLLLLAAIVWSMIEYSGDSERNAASITIVAPTIGPNSNRSSP